MSVILQESDAKEGEREVFPEIHRPFPGPGPKLGIVFVEKRFAVGQIALSPDLYFPLVLTFTNGGHFLLHCGTSVAKTIKRLTSASHMVFFRTS